MASCTGIDENVVTATDRQFVKDAAVRNLLNSQTGQIARTRGTTDEIRRYGEVLIRQASTTSEELIALAEKKEIILESTLTSSLQEDVNLLAGTPEANFNATYITKTIESLRTTIQVFEQQIKKGNDNELRSWASTKLPFLRQHLERAQTIRTTNNMQTPATSK
ncbi:DUF4142 domain-containing protein [Telluribacter sp.]|uniref:DUF4142 domain-containing protein n=1 Tax=Telluribacter sp. TaxID=1978767 RepID=UPI002E11694B|nr:DUF4142 domain-containing protein [Telluribacter sp.]